MDRRDEGADALIMRRPSRRPTISVEREAGDGWRFQGVASDVSANVGPVTTAAEYSAGSNSRSESSSVQRLPVPAC